MSDLDPDHGGYEWVDAHTHVFPTAGYGDRWQQYLGHKPRRPGTPHFLLNRMETGGIARSIMLLFPRSGERYRELSDVPSKRSDESIRNEIADEIGSLNRWGVSLAHLEPRLVPFVGVNVRFMSEDLVARELDELLAMGAAGVKIIPPAMKLYANDPQLFPIYQWCQANDIPLLSQSGSGGGPPPEPNADHYGRPSYFDDVLGMFPKLRLILAHMGLGYEDDIIKVVQNHATVYTDTSLRLSGFDHPDRWGPRELVEGIRRIGVERVLFGTNFPMTDPATYVTRMRELDFTEDELQKLVHDNIWEFMRW